MKIKKCPILEVQAYRAWLRLKLDHKWTCLPLPVYATRKDILPLGEKHRQGDASTWDTGTQNQWNLGELNIEILLGHWLLHQTQMTVTFLERNVETDRPDTMRLKPRAAPNPHYPCHRWIKSASSHKWQVLSYLLFSYIVPGSQLRITNVTHKYSKSINYGQQTKRSREPYPEKTNMIEICKNSVEKQMTFTTWWEFDHNNGKPSGRI